jgi:hypothetical protein
VNDIREMTVEKETDERAYFAYLDRMDAMRECAAIHPELDAALGAYMAGLEDPEAKAAALERFDAALVRLRDVYRRFEYQWDE